MKRDIEPRWSGHAGSDRGPGAIGTSIAYQLAARGAGVVVLERQAVACAASGKSGGFLALDWCDGTPLMGLARRSFALHAELAGSLDGDWGYRVMTTYAGEVGRSSALTSAPSQNGSRRMSRSPGKLAPPPQRRKCGVYRRHDAGSGSARR